MHVFIGQNVPLNIVHKRNVEWNKRQALTTEFYAFFEPEWIVPFVFLCLSQVAHTRYYRICITIICN